MEIATCSNNNLLVNQVRNLHHSERQVQSTVENSGIRENISELKMTMVRSAKQSSEKTAELEKKKLNIKNMECISCKIAVKAVLENLGLNYSSVEAGEVEIIGNLSDAKHEQLKSGLLEYGLELVEDSKTILVEKIKNVIIEMIHNPEELPNTKNSYHISKKLNHPYPYLANLFSEVTGLSIQHFIILHKIERAKELMMYDKLTLSEIAWKLHYSSVAHLSIQFKKITGLSPTHFKYLMQKRISSPEYK